MSDGHAPQAPLAPEPAGFFGRSDELAEVAAAIAGGWRLITLAGPPGVGKTRLARRAMRDLDGCVAFVDLSDTRDRDGLVAAVASSLGISLACEPRESAAGAVGNALARAGRAVLVLDNLEQLVAHAAVLSGWLEAAPRACFLVTSRERLKVAGERVVELGALSIAAGVALFEERASLGRPLFDDERAAAEAVVRRVDGIPLAVELAAGRAAVLGVPGVLARLDLVHASSADAVAWSWRLLGDAEKRALAQLSVFAGSFALDAAEAVVDLPRPAVADALHALRERSLLWARREPGGAVRFGLFEIVRGYAGARLDDDDALGGRGPAALRHARCFAARGAAAFAVSARGDGDGADVEAALLADADNLEAAFSAARAGGFGDDLVASLARSLSTLFSRRGTRAAHEEVLVAGIDAAARAGRADLECDLLQARAARASAAGDNAVALACQERALAAALAANDAPRAELARARRGWDRFELGDVDGGLADMRAAVEESARARDPAREAYARNRCGLALLACGSSSSALEELSRAAALAAQTRDRWLRQKTLVEVAAALRRLGSVEVAAQRLLELQALGAPVDRTLQILAGFEHAALARAFLRFDDALVLLEQTIATADDDGGPRLRAQLRVEKAAVLSDLGRGAEALAVLDDALALAVRVQSPVYRAAALLESARARAGVGVDDVEGARAALDLAAAAVGGGDAALAGAVLVERALLSAGDDGRAARDAAEDALDVLVRVGGKPLVVALCVAGLVDAGRVDERRSAAEVLLTRVSDAEARAAVGLLRGQPAPDTALLRRLLKLRGGRARREIVIGADARYYELDGQRVSLQRQRSLRLILLALVDQAEQKPGVGLAQTEVLARGWPGEKMRADSGATRVYTSIRRLRRGGLAGVLLTRDDGYLLDPSVAVRRA